MSTLTSIILARQVIEQTGERYALSGANVRILGAVSLLSGNNRRATYGSLMQLLGLGHATVLKTGANILARRGLLSLERGQGIIANKSTSLRLTAAGQVVLTTLERLEREAIAGIARVEVGEWKVKRKYVRSGQHVGKAAARKATQSRNQV